MIYDLPDGLRAKRSFKNRKTLGSSKTARQYGYLLKQRFTLKQVDNYFN